MDPQYEVYKMYRRIMERQFVGRSEGDSVFCELMKKVDESDPHFKARYDRMSAIQKTLTREQQDYICEVIGDWYVHWKGQLVTELKPGEHRLGVAKEHLKELICGDSPDE